MKNLVRYAVSIVLGLAIALPFMHLPFAHAASGQLTADDLLNPDFGEHTGLGQADLQQTIASLIRVGLTFLGVIAVVIMLYGGFKWMTAGGTEERVTEAKRLMIAGVIGLGIILSAYAISSFVINAIVGATNG